MSEDGPRRELLKAVHDFPCAYTIKAFGPHSQEFVDAIRDAAERAHTGDGDAEIGARASSKGNHICVTATVWVDSADGVYDLYASVKSVAGLRMLL